MSVDLKDLIGKTVDSVSYQQLSFTDGTVLIWDEDGCQSIYSEQEFAELTKL